MPKVRAVAVSDSQLRSETEGAAVILLRTLGVPKILGQESEVVPDERVLRVEFGGSLEIGARSYSSVNSILKNNLDRQRPATSADGPAIAHDNIRGPTYFH